MQTTASNNLVFTEISSLKRLADLQAAVSHGRFYQLLASSVVTSVRKGQQLGDLADLCNLVFGWKVLQFS